MPKKILIIAGESSGDLYGAHLVKALKARLPNAEFTGVGGAGMKEAGVEILHSIDQLAIIGLFEILPKLNVIKNLFSLLKKKIDEDRFDAAILVNYPGFNMRFARELAAKEIPVIFYSSPQVWAWGGWRVGAIKRYVDKMIVFMKFEQDFYKRYGVAAEFVGHPLVDIVRPSDNPGIKKEDGAAVVSLVPGSRRSEIRNMFAIMLKAARIMQSKQKRIEFLITKHPELPLDIYSSALNKSGLSARIIDGRIHDCLKTSDLAIAVSGSVTLEAALVKTPMIIVNRISFMSALLFLFFGRVTDVGLVNIIAGKRIVPELIQYNATSEKIAKEALDILSHRERYERMKEDLEEVARFLGPPGASERAAEIIGKLLK